MTIREIGDRSGWQGTPFHRTSTPSPVQTLPIIDNSNPYASNVRTSIDCYVSGQYVAKGGKMLEVTQRYTIFISYNKETQNMTMQQVRDRISGDFHDKYGNQFNISSVYVPSLPIPKTLVVPGVPTGGSAPMEFYGGSRMFRSMTEYEKMRWDIGTENTKRGLNIDSIRKRYGGRR